MQKPWITNIRVVLVLILSLGVLGTLIYYSFRSFERFTVLVDQLDDQPTWQAELAEDIVIDISELDRMGRTYQLTLSSEDLRPYLYKVDQLRVHIDSLYNGSYGTYYHDEVDTLGQVFAEKVQNFEALIKFKISQSVLADDVSALELLAVSRTEIETDSMLMPRQEVTTTTVTTSNQDSLVERGLFSRLFGGKDESIPNREMMQERTVAYDSAYFEKVDTLMASVESAIRQAESQRRYEQRLLANRELQIASNDLFIIEKLKSIAAEIRRLNEEMTGEQRQSAVQKAELALNRVLFWVICGGLLTIIFTIWVILDIFQSGRLQRDLERSKSKAERLAESREEFLANMSHELRTPLNSIIGFTGQLSNDMPKADERINHLRNSSEHLLRVVNDILDFSKIESGKLALESIGFKPATVIHECCAMIAYQAEEKGLDIRLELDEELQNKVLNGDPLRLKQIFINLGSNAIKFTDNGHVRVSAKLTTEKKGYYRVSYQVEDTGKGIDQKRLSEIFESFQQEDGTINRQYGGTGLGLAISKKLIELQGGELKVRSESGEGSVFSFSLVYPEGDKDVYSGNFQPQTVQVDLHGKSLLLVDDDEMNHILLKPSFEKWRLEFDSAFTGKQARILLDKRQYDYILLDIMLPNMAGTDLIEGIRQSGQGTKIVLCTANPLISKQQPELLGTVDGLLLKPFKEYEVAAALSGGEASSNQSLPETEAKPYDLKNFSKFAGDDPQILKKFIHSFIESNRHNLDLLDQYFIDKDDYALADVAHKMKNTYGQLEAERIMKRILVLENPLNKISDKRKKETIKEIRELSEELFKYLEKDLEQVV